MNLDRTITPPSLPVEKLYFPKVNSLKLDNGIETYYFHSAEIEIIKLELLFKAGSKHQQKLLSAYFANALIKNGTSKLSADQIADTVDFYGAYLESENHRDYSSIILYSTTKYLENLLPLLQEILTDAQFPEKEFSIFKKNKMQKFKVNSEKVDYLASKHFNTILFGKDHYYGASAWLSDFENLTREDVYSFYRTHYVNEEFTIIASGNVNENTLKLINKYLGNILVDDTPIVLDKPTLVTSSEKKHYIKKEGAIQSAIKIGKPLFTRNNPDFFDALITNCLLGGYFGSRLMSNIREDKGFTYGIYSALIPLSDAGYFEISTEVGKEVTNDALTEIYKELNLLCNEEVPKVELLQVQNYLSGKLLKSLDGPFSLAERFKIVHLHGFDMSYYHNYLISIKNITPAKVKEMAQKYFSKENMIELTVGDWK